MLAHSTSLSFRPFSGPNDAPIAPIAPTACTLFAPRGACLVGDSGPLVVCDTGHHRLLLWKSVPSVDDAPANQVIGQADFVSEGHSQNTISPATLNVPTGVASDPPGRPRRRRCVESSRAALAQPAARLEPSRPMSCSAYPEASDFAPSSLPKTS
jgi:hypothetical protein